MFRKMLAILMTLTLLATPIGAFAADAEASGFAQTLEAQYVDPNRIYSTDVRWWLGHASATDDTLMEEIQALYDGGFRGVELCMQSDAEAPDADYAYGSEMWAHKWKLIIETLLDMGMSVYLTSGTNWSTSNVPESYMSPDSQAASQALYFGEVVVEDAEEEDDASGGESAGSSSGPATESHLILSAGESVEMLLPAPNNVYGRCDLIAAYAYKIDEAGNVFYGSDIDLLAEEGAIVKTGEGMTDYTLKWTAPADSGYMILTLWNQGTYQSSSPGAETCYATNYFDKRGTETLKKFWEEHYLDDPELNEKIKNGHVELFMDSIELNFGNGFTWWSEDMRQQFIDRKGYDPMPYVFLVAEINGGGLTTEGPYRGAVKGAYDLHENDEMRVKLINDWQDVLTQVYEENMLIPLKEWLNSIGIATRAQISYGTSLEITEPSQYVDYPEAENLNQYNQIDIFRLSTGGSKLQNKVLSTETGGTSRVYGSSLQTLLNDAYSEFAAGFQRIVWHIWTADYGYSNYGWPGYMNGTSGEPYFNRWGSREPASTMYDELNAHLGRVQQLMRTGVARTDIGFIHNNWNQGLKAFGESNPISLNGMNWQFAHMNIYYRSTELQDHGYTYDYISPDLLSAEGVHYDAENGTVELAGYKALVIYQSYLDADGALKILDWAQQGLPVVILEHAAQKTPFNDGRDAELAETMAKLVALDNVRVAQINDDSEGFDYANAVAEGYDDDVYEALQELGVQPYAGFEEANHQLLTQSRADEDGNLYVYMYNYCPNTRHDTSAIEAVQTEDHGLRCETEMTLDGLYVPYQIDAWTGKVTELGEYVHKDGKTVIPVDLTYGNIALYAFEAVSEAKVGVSATDADLIYVGEAGLTARTLTGGTHSVTLSNGETKTFEAEVPAAYDITGWDVTVQSWTPNPEAGDLVREETIGDLTTKNYKTSTVVTEIPVELETLTTWDNIPEVGKEVSGVGLYEASFTWDASAASGAYIDFGETLDQAMEVWINGVKIGGEASANPTKAVMSVGMEIGDGKGGSYVPEGKEQYTGGISWTRPYMDISEYLVDGENTIRIEYRTALTNAALAAGVITPLHFMEGEGWSMLTWYGYDVDYRSSGPQQAKIVPFVDTVIG